MSILQRAATIAVMTFSLAGLIGHSAPVRASDLNRTAIPAPTAASTDPVAPASVADTVTPAAPAPVTPTFAPAHAVVQPLPTVEARSDDTYTSLAEAVAAQDSATIDETQRCLAGAIYFESKSESLKGQLAVGHVIANRAASGRFPSSYCGVVYQRSQFSFVRGGSMPRIARSGTQWKNAVAIARIVDQKLAPTPVSKALFFHARRVSPGWRLTRVATLGNHVFYR